MTEDTTTGSTMPRRQLGRSLRELRNARGWWHSYSDVIPEGFDVYLGVEEAASHFAWYASEMVPGLFQTEDYARTVIRADNPGVPDAGIERRLDVCIARQTLVTRVAHPPVVEVGLDEAILHHPVGGEETARGQLKRLVAGSELPTVSLRVIPFAAGLHHGIRSGPFEILRFPLDGESRETEPPMMYVDGFTADLYLDKPHEVDRYDTAFRNIWESSLDERASRELITQVARELGK
jgi:hypothetical protein